MDNWIPSEEETFAQIGCLLLLTQGVERSTSCLIGTVYPEGAPSWEELNKLKRTTLGGLIRKLSERVDIDPRFQGLLEGFLVQRNTFAHTLSDQSWFDMHSPAGRDRIWVFLEGYQKCLEEIYMVVSAAIFKSSEDAGFPRNEWHDKLNETGFLQRLKEYYPRSMVAFRKPKTLHKG